MSEIARNAHVLATRISEIRDLVLSKIRNFVNFMVTEQNILRNKGIRKICGKIVIEKSEIPVQECGRLLIERNAEKCLFDCHFPHLTIPIVMSTPIKLAAGSPKPKNVKTAPAQRTMLKDMAQLSSKATIWFVVKNLGPVISWTNGMGVLMSITIADETGSVFPFLNVYF